MQCEFPHILVTFSELCDVKLCHLYFIIIFIVAAAASTETHGGTRCLYDNDEMRVDPGSGLCHELTVACPRQMPQMYDLSRDTREHWEIPRSEIELTTQLGSGNFGEVWKGTWTFLRRLLSMAY